MGHKSKLFLILGILVVFFILLFGAGYFLKLQLFTDCNTKKFVSLDLAAILFFIYVLISVLLSAIMILFFFRYYFEITKVVDEFEQKKALEELQNTRTLEHYKRMREEREFERLLAIFEKLKDKNTSIPNIEEIKKAAREEVGNAVGKAFKELSDKLISKK